LNGDDNNGQQPGSELGPCCQSDINDSCVDLIRDPLFRPSSHSGIASVLINPKLPQLLFQIYTRTSPIVSAFTKLTQVPANNPGTSLCDVFNGSYRMHKSFWQSTPPILHRLSMLDLRFVHLLGPSRVSDIYGLPWI
jgi:hypothetical protein